MAYLQTILVKTPTHYASTELDANERPTHLNDSGTLEAGNIHLLLQLAYSDGTVQNITWEVGQEAPVIE